MKNGLAFWTGVVLGLSAASAATAGENELGTFRFDPVELVRGNKVEGKEDCAAKQYLFRYLFSSDENRAEFQKHPEKYEIQMGGGCARMGSLSGVGRTDIFAVHDGKIYIFASESCRAGFLKDPSVLLEMDDEPLSATSDERKQAAELLDRAVKVLGGAERLDALKSVRTRHERTVESGGVEYETTVTHSYLLPDGYRHDSRWNEDTYTQVVQANRGWFIEPNGSRPMHASQVREAQRTLRRNPIVLLRARNQTGFVAKPAGTGMIDARPVDFVDVSLDGSKTRLAIDHENGRIVSEAYRGRGPTSRYGRVELRFADYTESRGMLLPRAYEQYFEGEKVPDSRREKIEVDVDIDVSAAFQPPGE